MVKGFLSIAVCALVVGCGESREVGRRDVGVVVGVSEIPTSFNDTRRSAVETTGGIFFVVGPMSIIRGAPAQLIRYDNGLSYLCVDGIKSCKRVIGS